VAGNAMRASEVLARLTITAEHAGQRLVDAGVKPEDYFEKRPVP
jgi:hypothetical protein